MSMEPIEDLKLELQDPEFARFYGADQAQVQLALTLVAVRSKLGLTQKGIADKLETSQPYIAKLEKGDANPTIGKIGSMLALLDLRLVTGTAPLKPEPMPFSAGLVLTGAIGAGDAVFILGTHPPEEESQWLPAAQDFVNAGTALPLTPVESIRYRAREVVAGGAAR